MKDTELILQQLVILLTKNKESNWSISLQSLILDLKYSSTEAEKNIIKSQIRGIFGGMGSFSDLVLFKDGEILIDENNELDLLRRELYKSLT